MKVIDLEINIIRNINSLIFIIFDNCYNLFIYSLNYKHNLLFNKILIIIKYK